MRRVLLGICLLAAAGCGTAVYDHTIEVTALHGAAETTEVGVFDRQMGYSRDWAHRALGPSSASAPHVGTVSTTATVTLADSKQARPVTLSLAVPELTDDGYFQLTIDEPLRQQLRQAQFCGYGAYFPEANAAAIPVTVSAEAKEGDWKVELTVDLRQAKAALPAAP